MYNFFFSFTAPEVHGVLKVQRVSQLGVSLFFTRFHIFYIYYIMKPILRNTMLSSETTKYLLQLWELKLKIRLTWGWNPFMQSRVSPKTTTSPPPTPAKKKGKNNGENEIQTNESVMRNPTGLDLLFHALSCMLLKLSCSRSCTASTTQKLKLLPLTKVYHPTVASIHLCMQRVCTTHAYHAS